MPELPEVENVCCFLQNVLLDRVIRQFVILHPRLRYPLSCNMINALKDLKIMHIWRRGKYIIWQGSKNYTEHIHGDVSANARQILNHAKPMHNIDRISHIKNISQKTKSYHYIVILHLGMTGNLHHHAIYTMESTSTSAAPLMNNRHERLRFILDDDSVLSYVDMRKFGFLQVIKLSQFPSCESSCFRDVDDNLYTDIKFTQAKFNDVNNRLIYSSTPWIDFCRLGLEPLDNTFSEKLLCRVQEHIKSSVTQAVNIKTFLMNQRHIAGIGNIYASEILHDAGIHPTRQICSMQDQDWRTCISSIRKILHLAIKHGGTTIKDYLNPGVVTAQFQSKLQVYGRKSLPCLYCKNGIISNIVLSGRSTYFCANCQI